MNIKNTEEIHIIGAGLCGTLLAILLRKRGFKVFLFEKRPDIRKKVADRGRSINLALSHRGIQALKKAGIHQQVLEQAIPMYGRYLHELDGSTTILPYSPLPEEHINSISRLGLNQILIQEAEKAGVLLFFEHECTEVDLNRKRIRFRTPTEEKEVAFQVLFGTDGAGSPVRQSLKKFIPNFKETIETLEYGYKELTIPPTEEGAFRFPENHLHIWPRHSFMMIALPNRDRTFTCTLFLPLEGHFPSFAQLRAGDDVIAFFQETFPDAFPHLLALTKEFFENPTGYLGTVRCGPWHYQGDVLLLGDAAHTIVPFYGQGMNAAFEDCDLLDNLLDSFETWEKLFSHFYHQRKPDAEAIANLALDNFIEMRDQVLNPLFQQRRQIELALEKYYPDQFYSKYRLVTFTSVPYHQAKKQGEAQEEFLQNWIQFHGYPTTEKLSFVLRELKKYLKEKGFINPIPAS